MLTDTAKDAGLNQKKKKGRHTCAKSYKWLSLLLLLSIISYTPLSRAPRHTSPHIHYKPIFHITSLPFNPFSLSSKALVFSKLLDEMGSRSHQVHQGQIRPAHADVSPRRTSPLLIHSRKRLD